MSVVTKSNFDITLKKISEWKEFSLDTETTGLMAYHEDRLFSVIVSNGKETYYFNFQKYADATDEETLPHDKISYLDIISDPSKTIFLANAKFDTAMLYKEGVDLTRSQLWDVLVAAKVCRNDLASYSLEFVAAQSGHTKSTIVDEYISKNRVYTMVSVPGKKSRVRQPHYDRVPFKMIVPYAEKDAYITYRVGVSQKNYIYNKTEPRDRDAFDFLVKKENELTKACFAIEKSGILLDKDFCNRAIEVEESKMVSISNRYAELTMMPLVDSNKALKISFQNLGIIGGKTEKGNDSFTDNVLSEINHPVAELIREYRDSRKRANSYFKTFIFYADKDNVIHPNIRQSYAKTGRFSITQPALQTLTDPEKEEKKGHDFQIRRCFIPRPDYIFVEFDYKNMEFRAAIGEAKEVELALKIKNGFDPHQATADMVGITRKEAKTLNFLVLYGGGAGKLSQSLGIQLEDAKLIVSKYFDALPLLKKRIRNIISQNENHSFIRNLFGRKYWTERSKSYKAFNYYIQGSCAEFVKIKMVDLYTHLKEFKSRMILQVHDSILFEIHKDELYLVQGIKNTMEKGWPLEHILPMEVSCAWSSKSWADLIDGYPSEDKLEEYGAKTRDEIQKQDSTANRATP